VLLFCWLYIICVYLCCQDSDVVTPRVCAVYVLGGTFCCGVVVVVLLCVVVLFRCVMFVLMGVFDFQLMLCCGICQFWLVCYTKQVVVVWSCFWLFDHGEGSY